MTTDTYKQALKQAKADLVEQVKTLGRAQDSAAKAEKAIVELRQTIAALQVLCGEPEFVEEDALGLTDAIRMAFRTAGREMSAHDVREQMESMGYAGRWGNLLASIQTVIPRLFKKGEIQGTGNVNGRDTFRWIGHPIPEANAYAGRMRQLGDLAGERKAGQAPIPPRPRTVPPPPGSPGETLPTQDDLEQRPSSSYAETVPEDARDLPHPVNRLKDRTRQK